MLRLPRYCRTVLFCALVLMACTPLRTLADEAALATAKRNASAWAATIVHDRYDMGSQIDSTVLDAAGTDGNMWVKMGISWKGPLSGDEYWAIGEATTTGSSLNWKELSCSGSVNGYRLLKGLGKMLVDANSNHAPAATPQPQKPAPAPPTPPAPLYQPMTAGEYADSQRLGKSLYAASWLMPPVIAGDWIEVTDEADRKRILGRLFFELKTAGHETPMVGKIRAIKARFYDDGYICEIQSKLTGANGVVGSYFLLMAGNQVSLANGNGGAFINFHKSVKLDLADQENMRQYLRLFCRLISAPDGDFTVLETNADFQWTVNATAANKSRAVAAIQPMAVTRSMNGDWKIDTSMIYSDTISRVKLTVTPATGAVSMEEDSPVLAHLPLIATGFTDCLCKPIIPTNSDGLDLSAAAISRA